MDPPALPRTGLTTVRAAPGSVAELILPLPTGTPPFTYEWSRAGASLDDRFKTSLDVGGVRLTVSAAQTGDSGVYTLQASNAAGKDTTRVALEVSPDEMPMGDDPPAFLRRLQDLTVKVGTRTRFLVEIMSSTECKVTWYRNERRLLEAERIALVRDGNFWCADVATVSVDDAGRWTCTAENLGGRASCSAHLNVLVPKAYKRPEFVEELRAILTEQGTVSLECKVVGVPTPVLRWFKDSCEIKAGDVFALTANADDPTSLGTYTCEAINCMGRAYSSSKVHVIGRAKEGARPSSGGVTPDPPPIFTKELEDQFVRICEPLTLSCHIVVPPWPRSVVWYNKEGKIEASAKYHVLEDGVGGYLLEVAGAEWADEGEWKCVATSAGGRVGISACCVTMDVPKNYRKPRFMENLQAVLTEEGLVSFECKVVGFPTPVLSWFKDGQELKPGDVYQLTGTNSLGSYCCIARNCMGHASSSAELTVEDIQNQLNEEEKLQLFSKNQAPKFLQGLKSVEVKIDEPFRFTIKVAIPPEPTVLWYRDDQPVDESPRCHLGKEDRGVFYLDIKNLELMDQTEWKCVAMNDFGHSVTSCFLKLIIPRHFKKPRFLENLQAILSDEGAVNLECKVIGVPQPVLKWYKDGEELKPGDIHRIISGQDGTCCLGTYTCEAQNCMGIAASSASLLGFEDTVKAKNKKKAEEQILQRNLSLSTIHEERTSQMYDTPIGDVTLDDKGEISFSFDGKEVSVSLYETPDLTEEEALQIVEMYADQLSENVTEHNVVELPPLRFVKETSTSGNLLMEAIIIDVSPDYFVVPEEDLRTEADIEDISIAEENGHAHLSFDQDVGEDYLEKTMALLSEEKSDIPARIPRRKSDSQKSADDYFSLSKDPSLSEDKKDDDTQMLSESVSFASARSAEKLKSSKPSQDDEIATQESSEVTKTVLLKEDHRINVQLEDIAESKKVTTDEQAVKSPMSDIPSNLDSQSHEKISIQVTLISSLLSKIMNNIQVTERDIILKSQLMSTAAIASKSLEIINSLIMPLNEIHSITDAVKETIAESSEINDNLFSKLPDCLKEFQKSLTMVEKCVDVGNDKTFIKNTCISVIEKCDEDITNLISKIKHLTVEDLSFMGDKFILEVLTSTSEILNIIKIARSTVATKSIFDEEPKKDEISVDMQHLNDTQKAIYDLKIPLNSLLNIVENALKSTVINSMDINDAEVILINMSASIQDLQTALEHIEFLSVEESNSTLQKYNTNIIETVMGSVLKLRTSFESLSMEKEKRDDKDEIKNILKLIKVNLNEISSHTDQIENKIGSFDILYGDNKLEVLQKMAHILISLENSLPTLNKLPDVQCTMTIFHKNLTKVLENVIESNETSKYLTLVRICDAVSRITASIKNIESSKLLSLASIGNNFSIIEEIVKNNNISPDLNNEILSIVNQYFSDIQNIITYTEDENIRIDFEHAKDISSDTSYAESKACIVMHQIEQAIAVINKILPQETTSNMSNIYPIFENICPILEDLKYSVASLKQSAQEHESHISDLSEHEIVEIFGKPLRDLHENVTVLNQLLLESAEDSKTKSEMTVAVAEPLHELHNTLQILQENVISQYDSLSSLHANMDIASTAQILQNCFLIVQEQHEMEPVEEISTLEDVSCIKTTAESISSDHLLLPTTNEIDVEQASEKDFQHSDVSNYLRILNDSINEIKCSGVLNTLSEIKELAALKYATKSIEELQNEILKILPANLEESANLMCNTDSAISSLSYISQTIQTLDNYLSVIVVYNIPNYQDVLQVSSDKMQSIANSVLNLKVNLEKCQKVIMDIPKMVQDESINTNCLQKLSDDYKMCIKDLMEVNLPEETSMDDLKALDSSIENFLKVLKTPEPVDSENIKIISEKLYNDIIKIQDEFIFYTVQPLAICKEDNEIIKIVNEMAIALNVVPYETYVPQILDIDGETSQKCDIIKETESLINMEDVIISNAKILSDSANDIPMSDLNTVQEFFETYKSSFFILRTLLCQRPSQKKVIRVLQEFLVLQDSISKFQNTKKNLNLSQDAHVCLDNFFIQTGENLQKIQTSLQKIVSSLSKTLFSKPLENINESSKYFSQYSKEDNVYELYEVVQSFLKMLSMAQTYLGNLQEEVISEIQCSRFCDTNKEEESIIECFDNFLDMLKIKSANTTNKETKTILNKIILCIQKHQDFKNALGTGKKLIILKCLSNCSDILRQQLIEQENQKLTISSIDEKSLQIAISKIIQPLKRLNSELNKLKEEELSESIIQSIPTDTIYSCIETITQMNQSIDKYYVVSADFMAGDVALVKEVDMEVQSIQETLRNLQNVQDLDLINKISTPIENTKECIQKILMNKNVSSEHKLPKEKTEALLQHMEQYIEITEIIEEISAIINVSDIKEAKKIAEELRESIASSELIPDIAPEQVEYHIVTENQENLAQLLKKSLHEIQEQAFESTEDLIGQNKDVKQQVIEVITQLQEDLDSIANVQIPLELSTTSEINAEENLLLKNNIIEEPGIFIKLENEDANIEFDSMQETKDENDFLKQNHEVPKIIESIVFPQKDILESKLKNTSQKDNLESIHSDRQESMESTVLLENSKMLKNFELTTDSEVSDIISYDSKIVTEECKDLELSTACRNDGNNAKIAIHQIEEAITAINNIHLEETSFHSNEIYPVLENICPILEDLKYNIASLQLSTQDIESHASDISDTVLEQSFGKPLRRLHENIIVLNQLILDSVKDSVENINEATVFFAKPLQELHNTLQILQENVISQYESLSSLQENLDIATTKQILQSCCLLVQEQLEIEGADDISTLEDLSALKTTADSITSDILPVAQETFTTTKECQDIVKEDIDLSKCEQFEIKSNVQVSFEKYEDDLQILEKDQAINLNISESKEETKEIIELEAGIEVHNIETEIAPCITDECKITGDMVYKIDSPEKNNSLDKILTEEYKDDNKIPSEEILGFIQQEVRVSEQQKHSSEIHAITEPDNTDNQSIPSEVTLENCSTASKENVHMTSEDIKKDDDIKSKLYNEDAITSSSPGLELKASSDEPQLTSAVEENIVIKTHEQEEKDGDKEVSEKNYISMSTQILNKTDSNLNVLDTFQLNAINYVEVIQNMDTLLVDLKQNIELSTISIIDNADVLQNILDEFQIEILKLKSEINTQINDALTETLNDLECSVRSVQLQVSENSPPEHIMEASATLLLLVSTVKDVLQTTESSENVELNKGNTLVECLGDSENTILLLDKVTFTKKDEDEIINIIKSLNCIKDTIKSIKQSFSIDEDTVIDKGVDILQSLDMIENQLFTIENEIENVTNVDLTTRDTIVTAVHSVYTSISNMRGTMSSIQKRYIYQNYGKPSENLLNAIKNINKLSKLDKRSNWRQLSKYLRKTLNHFEDIKFYINFDKTARLPSDASLTKVVLNELKLLLTNIILANIVDLNIPLVHEVHKAINKLNEQIENIASQSILEVKNKIPIFKEISLQILETTNMIKEFYETSLSDDIATINTKDETVPLQGDHLVKGSEEPENKPERLVQNVATDLISESESLNIVQNISENLVIVTEDEISIEKGLLRENIQPIIQRLIDDAIDKVICIQNTQDFISTKNKSSQSFLLDLTNGQTEKSLLNKYDDPQISEEKEMQEIVLTDEEKIDYNLNGKEIGEFITNLTKDYNENEQTIQSPEHQEIIEEKDILNDMLLVDNTAVLKQSLDDRADNKDSITNVSDKLVSILIKSDTNENNNVQNENTDRLLKVQDDKKESDIIPEKLALEKDASAKIDKRVETTIANKNISEEINTNKKDDMILISEYTNEQEIREIQEKETYICPPSVEEKPQDNFEEMLSLVQQEENQDLLISFKKTSEIRSEDKTSDKNNKNYIPERDILIVRSDNHVDLSKDIDQPNKDNLGELNVVIKHEQSMELTSSQKYEELSLINDKNDNQEKQNKEKQNDNVSNKDEDLVMSKESDLKLIQPTQELLSEESNVANEEKYSETGTNIPKAEVNIEKQDHKQKQTDKVLDIQLTDLEESTEEFKNLAMPLTTEERKNTETTHQVQIIETDKMNINVSSLVSGNDIEKDIDIDSIKRESLSEITTNNEEDDQSILKALENKREELSYSVIKQSSEKQQHKANDKAKLKIEEPQEILKNENIVLSIETETEALQSESITILQNIVEPESEKSSEIPSELKKLEYLDEMTKNQILNAKIHASVETKETDISETKDVLDVGQRATGQPEISEEIEKLMDSKIDKQFVTDKLDSAESIQNHLLKEPQRELENLQEDKNVSIEKANKIEKILENQTIEESPESKKHTNEKENKRNRKKVVQKTSNNDSKIKNNEIYPYQKIESVDIRDERTLQDNNSKRVEDKLENASTASIERDVVTIKNNEEKYTELHIQKSLDDTLDTQSVKTVQTEAIPAEISQIPLEQHEKQIFEETNKDKDLSQLKEKQETINKELNVKFLNEIDDKEHESGKIIKIEMPSNQKNDSVADKRHMQQSEESKEKFVKTQLLEAVKNMEEQTQGNSKEKVITSSTQGQEQDTENINKELHDTVTKNIFNNAEVQAKENVPIDNQSTMELQLNDNAEMEEKYILDRTDASQKELLQKENQVSILYKQQDNEQNLPFNNGSKKKEVEDNQQNIIIQDVDKKVKITEASKIDKNGLEDEHKTDAQDDVKICEKDKSKSNKKRSSLEKKEKQKKTKLKEKASINEIEKQNYVPTNDDQETVNKRTEVMLEGQDEIYKKQNNGEETVSLYTEEKETRKLDEHMEHSNEIKQQIDNETNLELKSMSDSLYEKEKDQKATYSSNKQPYVIREKPQFLDPNIVDSSVEFSRPPGYLAKPYDTDDLLAPGVNTYSSTSKVFYKAQSLVREHQIRSNTMDVRDTNLETKDKPSEKRLKTKALSETRSVTEKRVGCSRDLKRKPVFSTHLTNRTAVEGSRVKLTCSVLSSTEPVMTWYKNGAPIDDKQKYKIKFSDGLITMELLNAIPSDSGDYSCTVENENGSVTSSAKLKVYPSFESSPIPPTFTRSIRDIYHTAENELLLECRIRGQPLPTITWLKDNQPISSDPRYEASYLADGLCRLTISDPTVEDSGTYTCKAESAMWFDQITHVVNFTGKESRVSSHISSVDKTPYVLDSRRPHFTNVLSDYKVVKGGTIGLQVEIGGAPTRVEWLREGSCVTELYRNAQTFVDHGIYTLALSDVTEKHSGLYTCRAWSTHGNVDMNADITVVHPSEVEGKPAVIICRPAKDLLISVGEDINISFRVQGEPKPKVIFMKGIRDITNSQRVCKMTSDDYVKFTLKRSGVSDAGTYCVLARNAYGCDRAFITVVVRQRASSEHLISDWTYPMDDQAIVASDRKYKSVPGRIPGEPSAVDGGNNWLTLAWPKPDPNDAAPVLAYRVDSWLLGKDGGARWIEMGITPRNTFDAFNLKQGEEYHFRVTPRNRYGWGEPVQTSTPIGVGIAGDRPEFIDILPGLLKVLVGETANLSCSFKGKPTPEILWMKNGHEIEEASRIRSLQSGNVCSLTIPDVKIEDEGRYSCEATNVHGRASTYARMTVITDRQIWEADAKLKRERSADAEGEYPPQFTMRLRDRRVQATYPVRLTCQVIGSPAPTVTWFKDGQEVVLDSRRAKYLDEHFHTLEIAPTTLDDGGVYEALARNGCGAISCRCSLVVDKGIRAYIAPEFCCGLEPSYRLNEGEELRISAIVEAYPSVGVTWYRDGVRLRPSRKAVMTLNRDGQIELALASVTPRDAGVYTCTASNEVGQASTSGKVEIVTGARQDQRTLPTVICPDVPYSKEPMFLKKPRSTEAQEGDTVIIECEVIGDPTPDVYWLRDFLKPDYYRDANHFKQMAAGPLYRFEIPHAKLDYTGAYSVVARNTHGEAKAIISLQIFAKDLRSTDDTHNIRYGRVEVIPRFEKELTDLLCYDGDAVEFECRVSGNPEPDIRWFHYNEVLPECPDFESTYQVGTARLKIKQVAAEDEGTYTCEASNNLGKATSKACLVVYPPGEPNTLSQRLQRPPALSSAASTPRSTPRTTPARSVSRTPGPDVCRLRSPAREVAPKFYTYPFNKVVEEGESVIFQCAVGGLPPPWATWDKDSIIITPTSRISIKEKDEMLRILQIDQVTVEDVGLYRITLENDYGRAEASARLEVISHKGKFYAGTRSSSASPRRMMTYRRRTPSYTRQD